MWQAVHRFVGFSLLIGGASVSAASARAESLREGDAGDELSQLCAAVVDSTEAGDYAGALSFDNDKIGGAETDASYTTGVRFVVSQAGFAEYKEDNPDAEAYPNEDPTLRFFRSKVRILQNALWSKVGLIDESDLGPLDKPRAFRHAIGGGLSIFTPETTDQPVVPTDERPYGGSHYLLYGLTQEYCDDRPGGRAFLSNRFVSNIEYQVGWIGSQPAHGIIETFHNVWPAGGHTDGWDTRHINYEPMINIFYNRIWSGFPFPSLAAALWPESWGSFEDYLRKRSTPLSYGPLGLQFRPHAGFALGNAYTYANAGLTVSAGIHLPDNVGPPTIRPALPGSDYFERRTAAAGDECSRSVLVRCKPADRKDEDGKITKEKVAAPLSIYAFAGIEQRAVAFNAFLDGNLFSESPSVDKNFWVDDKYMGFAVEFGRVRLSYSRVYRSPEFEGQGDTVFGAVTLGVNIGLPKCKTIGCYLGQLQQPRREE